MVKAENYKLKNLKPNIKTDEKFFKFDDAEIEKYKFHQHKSPISIDNIDINKIVVSNNFPYGKTSFKYFIRYKIIKN